MDGTTATTLAPSEEEMNHAVGYIQRMKDAIVEGSKLAQSFAELRGEFDKMRGELESLRSTNRWMDTQITELRVARDEALATCNRQATEIVNLRNEGDSLRVHCDNQRETLARLNEQVGALRKERDDALYAELEAKNYAEEIQKKLDTIVGLVCPKEANTGTVTSNAGGAGGQATFPEQPRDPETQQFKPWENRNTDFDDKF